MVRVRVWVTAKTYRRVGGSDRFCGPAFGGDCQLQLTTTDGTDNGRMGTACVHSGTGTCLTSREPPSFA